MDLAKIIGFMKEAEKFKTCLRTCRTTALDRAESDAEHSWHLALFLLLLRDRLQGLDFEKLLSLALIHDLPEIYAGDTNPYRDDSSTKDRDEKKAAEKLFDLLPGAESKGMDRLFREYADQSSPEARTVKALDKLMPLIQNLCTNKEYSSYRRLEVELLEVEEYMEPFFDSRGLIRELYNLLLAEAKSKGVFHNPLPEKDRSGP
jgi:putative hydrolase of HD superfamily